MTKATTKVLAVNNDSDTWQELIDSLCDAGFEVGTLHCREIQPDSANGYDVVVLSGGWWYDDEMQHLENYKNELELIKQTPVPMLGICQGMQLMQLACSGQITLLDKPQHDLQSITIEPRGQELLGLPDTMVVHKNHTMGAIVAAPGFEVLGRSHGHIEIIGHKTKPLLGVQFHPEVGDPHDRAAFMHRLVVSVIALSRVPEAQVSAA
jgi:GMP synthase-like glutamine amidotransferase